MIFHVKGKIANVLVFNKVCKIKKLRALPELI